MAVEGAKGGSDHRQHCQQRHAAACDRRTQHEQPAEAAQHCAACADDKLRSGAKHGKTSLAAVAARAWRTNPCTHLRCRAFDAPMQASGSGCVSVADAQRSEVRMDVQQRKKCCGDSRQRQPELAAGLERAAARQAGQSCERHQQQQAEKAPCRHAKKVSAAFSHRARTRMPP